jgi:cytidyltransferase-like protein
MILTFDQLREYRQQVAMVDGAFDPLHRGHIEYFRAAAAQLDAPCCVASDTRPHQDPPLLPEPARRMLIRYSLRDQPVHTERFARALFPIRQGRITAAAGRTG